MVRHSTIKTDKAKKDAAEKEKKQKKKETEEPITDAQAHAYKEELLRIRDQNDLVVNRQLVMLEKKQTYEAAKKSFEASQGDLNDIIAELRAPNLFRPALDDESPKAKPDGWMREKLDLPLFPKGVQRSLNDAKLTTYGAIAEFTKDLSLTAVVGIGEAGAKMIEDSIENFFATHPEYTRNIKGDEKPAKKEKASAIECLLDKAKADNQKGECPNCGDKIKGKTSKKARGMIFCTAECNGLFVVKEATARNASPATKDKTSKKKTTKKK